MTILEEVEIKLDYADMDRRIVLPRLATPDGFILQHPRSSGVHMSGILKPLAIAAKQCKATDILEDEYPLMWFLGIAWEEAVASLYPTMDYQPGGICVDGIHMTCDGLNWLDEWGEACVEEMKSTYRSSTFPFKDEWMKLAQGKAYCHGYGPRIVRWHSCHLRGDYKSFGPIYKRRTVRFSDTEIAQNWAMFVKNKSLGVAEKGS